MDIRNKLVRITRSATMIEANELRSVIASFVLVFILMAAYYILRPVRDAMAGDWSNTEISVLWNIQFFISLALVAFFGLAVSRIQFRFLVQAVYLFFAISFVVFHFISTAMDDPVLVNKGFYLWVSLFSLFHVSVFWIFMADLYNKEQSRRLFAFIAVGASVGAIFGPLFAAVTVSQIGSESLPLLASVMLLLPLPLILYLQHCKFRDLNNRNLTTDIDQFRIGGASLAGFKLFFSSPYLIGIAAFILLYTAISSFAYFERTNLLREYSMDQRTQILAWLALVVNILTFVLGFFATSHLVTRFGMASTLALMPLFIVLRWWYWPLHPFSPCYWHYRLHDRPAITGSHDRPGKCYLQQSHERVVSRPSLLSMWRYTVVAMRFGQAPLRC
jgi:ATP:ADP antiporter, AAA family